jgi:hypothetical protein
VVVFRLNKDAMQAGFKKEHLRVQIDNYGRLRISGERPLEGNQWSRFRKDIQVPEGCDAGGIRARFEKDGVLHITMPRLSPVDLPEADHDAEAVAAAAAAEEKKRHEDARKGHAGEDQEEHAGDDDEGRGHQDVAASGAGGGTAYGFARDQSGMLRRLLISVALALVGAAGLYARYRLMMDPSGETAPADDAMNATAGLSDY